MTKSTITREPITHDIKIYPEFFSAVCTGVKRAELRKNDRDYRVGDTLHLMETPRGSCHQTGEFINVKITHIADVGEWMPGYVLLSVELQERRKADSDPVAEITEDLGRLFVKIHYPTTLIAGDKLYRHAQPAPVVSSEPVAYIFKHPAGRLFWSLTDESNKGHDDVMPVYAAPQPAPVVPEEMPTYAISPYSGAEYEAGYRDGWNACRAAMLHAGNSPAQSDCCPAQNHVSPEQSPIDHGYRPECECSGCKATARICAELSANSPVSPGCWCRTCRPVVLNDMRFVVCPDCGNKRCPRANDHRNACAGSNEPGQEGSAYPDTPQEVKP